MDDRSTYSSWPGKKGLWSGPGLLHALNYPSPALAADIRLLLSCTSCPCISTAPCSRHHMLGAPLARPDRPYLHSHSRAHSSDKGLIQTAVRMWNSLPEECVDQITDTGLWAFQAFKGRWIEKPPDHTVNRIWLLNGSEPCDWSTGGFAHFTWLLIAIAIN